VIGAVPLQHNIRSGPIHKRGHVAGRDTANGVISVPADGEHVPVHRSIIPFGKAADHAEPGVIVGRTSDHGHIHIHDGVVEFAGGAAPLPQVAGGADDVYTATGFGAAIITGVGFHLGAFHAEIIRVQDISSRLLRLFRLLGYGSIDHQRWDR